MILVRCKCAEGYSDEYMEEVTKVLDGWKNQCGVYEEEIKRINAELLINRAILNTLKEVE